VHGNTSAAQMQLFYDRERFCTYKMSERMRNSAADREGLRMGENGIHLFLLKKPSVSPPGRTE